MKALKWVGIGVGGFVAFVGAIVAVVFMAAADAASAANEFLRLVSEQKYEAAYQATTPQLRQEISFEKFRAEVKLSRFESVSWHSREVSTKSGVTLEGTIELRDGVTATAIINLEKIEGVWKVYGVFLKRDVS